MNEFELKISGGAIWDPERARTVRADARSPIDCTGMPGRLAPEFDPAGNFAADLGL